MTTPTPDDPTTVSDDVERDDMTMRPVVIRVTEADLEAWRRITARRYPRDKRRMSQVIRELIREEDERGARDK